MSSGGSQLRFQLPFTSWDTLIICEDPSQTSLCHFEVHDVYMIWANQPIHSFLVECLNPCLQGINVWCWLVPTMCLWPIRVVEICPHTFIICNEFVGDCGRGVHHGHLTFAFLCCDPPNERIVFLSHCKTSWTMIIRGRIFFCKVVIFEVGVTKLTKTAAN